MLTIKKRFPTTMTYTYVGIGATTFALTLGVLALAHPGVPTPVTTTYDSAQPRISVASSEKTVNTDDARPSSTQSTAASESDTTASAKLPLSMGKMDTATTATASGTAQQTDQPVEAEQPATAPSTPVDTTPVDTTPPTSGDTTTPTDPSQPIDTQTQQTPLLNQVLDPVLGLVTTVL